MKIHTGAANGARLCVDELCGKSRSSFQQYWPVHPPLDAGVAVRAAAAHVLLRGAAVADRRFCFGSFLKRWAYTTTGNRLWVRRHRNLGVTP